MKLRISDFGMETRMFIPHSAFRNPQSLSCSPNDFPLLLTTCDTSPGLQSLSDTVKTQNYWKERVGALEV